jgi:hypothetical protein
MKKKMTRFWKQNPLTQLPPHPIAIEAVFENFQKNVENMIALCKGRNLKVSIITLGTPLRKEYTLSQESMIRERFGRDFLRLTPAEMTQFVFRFNRILRDLSRKYQCRLYDWEKWYHGMDDAAMFVDLVHPSDKGYRHLVTRIVESADY